MRWLREHPLAAVSLAVFLLAAGLRLGFWRQIHGLPADRWHEWDQSDMATYLAQAEQLAGGDWLASEPYHPYHLWQDVAPPEKWLEWYGPHSFHQAPGYAYLLAVSRLVLDDPLPAVKVVQLLLGACTCVLLVWIGSRVGGVLAGAASGFLGAVYGPLLYLEPRLLREGPAIFFLLAVLWLLLRHVGAPSRPLRRVLLGCTGLGAAVGAYSMFHEMGTVLALVVLISLAVHHGRARLARGAAVVGLVLAGYLLGFAPLLARNLAVGAPPLAVSCRTHINFVEANEATARAGGALFTPPGPTVVAILDESQGSFLRAVRGTWASYEGDYGRMLANWWQRFTFVWQRWEEADNTSLYYYERVSALLASLPDFRLAFPLGLAAAALVLAGAALAMRRGRRAGELRAAPGPAETAWLRDPAAHLVLLLYLLGMAGALSLVHAVARFRLYLVPYFLLYAGVALALLVWSVRQRRWGWAGALALLVAASAWLQALATPAWAHPIPRVVDYRVATVLSLEEGDHELAWRRAEDAARFHPREPSLFGLLGLHYEQEGDLVRASEAYRRGLELRPGAAALRAGLERVRRQLGDG